MTIASTGTPRRGLTAPATGPTRPASRHLLGLAVYLAMGTLFGVILVKSQVVSWFRIQEMFRFDGIYMYGVFGTAVPVAALALAVLRRVRSRALNGEEIRIPSKEMGRGTRYWAGGLLFGVGWALTGACPGPLFALWGSGVGVFGVAILSAIAGTWAYGQLRPRLPH
jgi:uncharacterized membrane protein YedE/YeeE